MIPQFVRYITTLNHNSIVIIAIKTPKNKQLPNLSLLCNKDFSGFSEGIVE